MPSVIGRDPDHLAGARSFGGEGRRRRLGLSPRCEIVISRSRARVQVSFRFWTILAQRRAISLIWDSE